MNSERVISIFEQYADREFVLVEPGGNVGDQLIFLGARKIARKAGISFVSVSFEEFDPQNYSPEHVIYIHGSGGYNPWWSGKPINSLKKALDQHEGVVILGPTTFATDQEFINQNLKIFLQKKRGQKVFIMARERVSYNILREVLPGWVVLVHDHDTALNLHKTDLPGTDIIAGYTLFAIRDDKEHIPFQRRAFFNVWIDPVRHANELDPWMHIHAKADRIITNRLHSAILGSILGKETTLLPNNYHKNRSVWEYSLRDSRVSWSDELPGIENVILINNNNFIAKTIGNKWIQKAIRRFNGFKKIG